METATQRFFCTISHRLFRYSTLFI